ncbi:MAG: ABC transporter substrate-binding protein [Aestuariivita sp.]|nr:ABC transporter substrate-binding protein [Aestuariivita sp.]
MKKILSAVAAILAINGSTSANEVKIGVMLGFTGPIESLTPPMADAAEFAMQEVTDSKLLLDRYKVSSVRADSTCIDSAVASSAAERLITSDGVKGIMGADCSGVTGAVLQNVALPNGIVMISPSATSPGLSHNNNEDNGLFFRTAPSDTRQGVVMTEVLIEQGVKEVAISYVNNDYGKGLADTFQTAFEKAGGTITLSTAHESGKGDYSAEIGALAAAGGERLVVIGYLDEGGAGIVRAAIDSGAFDTFHFPDGMVGENLEKNFGSEIDGSTGQNPSTDSPGASKLKELVGGAFKTDSPYTPESYDATALILLAMQAAGSIEPSDYKKHIFDVANAPGEEIYPGELAKALGIIKNGGDVNYVGATAVELIGAGESAGNYREFVIENGTITTVKYR